MSRTEAGSGLRAFTVRGGRTFHLFDDERVWDMRVAMGRAYVRTTDALHIVDVTTGRVVGKIAHPPELADVITARS